MKTFAILCLAAIVAFASADEVLPKVQEFVGELRDTEGSETIKIGAYYYDHHDSPETPTRQDRPQPAGLPSCEFRPSTADSECFAKCVDRLHTGGICKGKICTCSDLNH